MRVKPPAIEVDKKSKLKAKLKKMPWLVEVARYAVLLIIIILVVVAVLLWRHHYNSKKVAVTKIQGVASAADVERLNNSTAQGFLNSRDFISYQYAQSQLAFQYVDNGDINNALRVENDLIKKIPEGKIISATYEAMIHIQKAKNDNEQIKHYEQLLIPIYKHEGEPKSAAALQKDLDKR